MIRRVALLGLVFAGAVAAAADAPPKFKDGNWWVGYGPTPIIMQPLMIVKAETKDGKTTGTLEAVPAKAPYELDSFKLDGQTATVVIKIGKRKLTFIGVMQPDGKSFKGTFGDDRQTDRGYMMATEATKVDAELFNSLPKAPESYQKAIKIANAAFPLRTKARQAKDIDEKADLMAKAAAAQEKADADSPAAWKEVITADKGTPYAVAAAQQLINAAGRTKADAKDVAAWVAMIQTEAGSFSPKILETAEMNLATTLSGEKAYADIAAGLLKKPLAALTDKDPLAKQSKVLKVAKKVYEAAGNAEMAKKYGDRFDAVEAAMDKEYLATVPPFKVPALEARKGDGTKAVLMELFTGAQCPPCVAADVAFDALAKAYDHKDVILLQYHMHIPGPDPMTNSDTVARFNFYGELYPKKVGGTPTAMFNGKIDGGSGGGMDNSEDKFGEYRKAVDKRLPEKADVTLTGKVGRVGDKLTIDVTAGVKEPKDLKLRLALTEDTIHYVGGNALRYHHHVVRTFVGGVAGTALKDEKTAKTMSVDLAQVQADLAKYQETYAKAEKITYNNAAPKMDSAKLKLVAFVQNDETGEILNAVQLDVPAK